MALISMFKKKKGFILKYVPSAWVPMHRMHAGVLRTSLFWNRKSQSSPELPNAEQLEIMVSLSFRTHNLSYRSQDGKLRFGLSLRKRQVRTENMLSLGEPLDSIPSTNLPQDTIYKFLGAWADAAPSAGDPPCPGLRSPVPVRWPLVSF